MIRAILNRLIPEEKKKTVKGSLRKLKGGFVNVFLSYDADDLRKHLIRIGIAENDTLLVHANFNSDNGFRGDPMDIVNVLVDRVGRKGNLMMVSIPFRGSAYDYLMAKKPFRLKKTMSMMGLLTESFRRKEGVQRSFHPTHPVLAFGKDSRWLVEEHENCLYPCGAGTPFEKFRNMNGKIMFFDVVFGAITFFHYVEDLYKEKIPLPVYHDDIITVLAYDKENQPREIRTYAFNKDLHRSAKKLEQEMWKHGLIRKSRIGNSRILLVGAEDVVRSQGSMIDGKNYPYDL